MIQPKCYVIAHPTSRVIKDCEASLKLHNWDYEIFPAVKGSELTEQSWQAINVTMSQDGKMRQRPGAQGCWMSHWQLWNLCITTDRPIVVMEHDAVVNGPWPEDLDIAPQLVKLYSPTGCKNNTVFGRWSKGAHAYTITPTQANRIIQHARANGAQAADKHLGDLVLPWTFLNYDLVTLNPGRGPSSTSKVSF